MGFFSWTTADTQESIPNMHSDREIRTVYLLQPNGQKALCEKGYEGYGVFAGRDAYELLAEQNAESLGLDIDEMSEEELRLLGIGLECGTALRDTETGEIWHVFQDYRPLIAGNYFSGNYGQPIPEFGASANQLVEAGRFERMQISGLVGIKFPLKFSFNENAIYENLDASKNCPYQGYFY